MKAGCLKRLPELHSHLVFIPGFLMKGTHAAHLKLVEKVSTDPEIIAIGEAGFDKLRGPASELQAEVFEKQVEISERLRKPLIIHCVSAWDEVLAMQKSLKPSMPWMIHGFRGKLRQAEQLISKGF